MGREIKFRAWDREEKRLMDVKLIDFAEWWVNCGPSGIYGERNSFKNEETDRHILMQYTGLKDKNGKEIYESDIIRFMEGNRLLGYVEYVDGKFQIHYSNIKGFLPKICGDWLECYEVIGNCFENTNLLEAER